MHIIMVGMSHQTAPLEIREKISFTEDTVKQAMFELGKQHTICENVIISTCNRTEIYVVTGDVDAGIEAIYQFLSEWFRLEEKEFSTYVSIERDEHAVDHLFRIATGLDSMVIGETQILGQVRQAFLTAQDLGTTKKVFNELFKRVITFAKRAHRDTGIGEQAVSISYVAVELSKKIFGDIQDKHIVILGAGETSELTLKNLQGAGVSKITVINRTLERAQRLADTFSAKAVPIANLLDSLREADILISSTGSATSLITKENLKSIVKSRKGNPLFLIDIAVPRDLDPEISTLDNVFLYDLDDLQTVVNQNLEARQEAALQIKKKLGIELVSFNHWLEMFDAIPVIQALQEKSLTIQENTLDSIYRKIPDLTDREMKVLKKHTKSIVHQLLKDPINQVKNMGNKEEALEMFRVIFGLEIDEDPPKTK